MRSTTYVALQPDAFSALLQATEIGGLRLEPFDPVEVRDQFFDTPTGELLSRGLALRVREQDGARSAAVRRLRDGAMAPALPEEVRMGGGATNQLVPPGPFAEALRRMVGDEPLTQVLALRQSRTIRVGLDDGRAVALFSMDVVVYETPGAASVSNEVEVEALGAPSEDRWRAIDRDLAARGFVPEPASKYERGVARVPRSLSQAVLLTPAEREALEAAARSGAPLLERRARVVLLDARGLRPDTIAGQTGLSMARVRHWRLRFRSERLGILEADERAAPETAAAPPAEVAPPAEAAPGAELATEPAPMPVFTPEEPEASPASGPAGGDGLVPPGEDPTHSRDMAELLDLFAPAATDTPLLGDDLPADGPFDEESADEDLDDLPLAGGPVQSAPVAEAPPRLTARPAGPRGVAPARAAYPVVLGPFPLRAPAPPEPDAPEPARPRPEAEAPPRRPALTGETPLLEAARSTLAYHVAAVEAAGARLAERRSVADVRRLLLAAHRVRLAVEAFGMVLSDAAADRVRSALRPLVAALDAALDADRAAAAVPDRADAFLTQREAAIDAALARLQGERHRAWTDHARRLLARLGDQRADGLLGGDDVPRPPDDFVGEVGDVPGPTRLRHVLASMLWARYEAVRAFEADLDAAEVSAEGAYHLAVAVSGLHFVLGLAERASGGGVREVAETLDAVEHRILAYRDDRRAAALRPEAGGPDGGGEAVREAWRVLVDPAFRARLAEVAAGV